MIVLSYIHRVVFSCRYFYWCRFIWRIFI